MSETEAFLSGAAWITALILFCFGGFWAPRASSVVGPVCLVAGATISLVRVEWIFGQSWVSLVYAALIGAATTLVVIRYRADLSDQRSDSEGPVTE